MGRIVFETCLLLYLCGELSPSLSSSDQTKQRGKVLETLRSNLSALEGRFQNNPEYGDLGHLRDSIKSQASWYAVSDDVTWNFTSDILILLLCLKRCMIEVAASFNPQAANPRTPEAAPALSPDTLSISQQKNVQSALQFVVTLGLCPCLLPGVGIPLKHRSEFGAVAETLVSWDHPPSRVRRLYVSCIVLLDIASHSILGSLILTRHLGDIIAGLCQLGYCPAKTKGTQTLQNDSAQLLTEEEQSRCRDALKSLLDRVYQPNVIKELLILQGGLKQGRPSAPGSVSQPLVQAPCWLRRLCGQLLSERLLKENGVKAVVQGILEGAGVGAAGGQGAETAVADWRKCDTVARILASCPQQSLSVEEYYRQVCPQVLDLLHITDKLTARQFQRVSCSTFLAMVKEQPKLAEKYLFKPLLTPLLKCVDASVGTQEELHPGAVIVDEATLTQCIEDLYKIYVVGNEPNIPLISSLQSVLQAVFALYCFTKHSVSHLRSLCQEIVLWYLQKCEHTEAITALKQLARLNGSVSKFHPAFQFCPGSDGGAVITVKSTISEEDEALYQKVSSEQWRIECLVDLLSNLRESGLSGDFFISCLKDLTSMAAEEEEEERKASTLTDMDSFLEREKYEAQQIEKQEAKLLTLQLIAALCEKVTSAVFSNTVQVIEFIAATLQRACVCLAHNTQGTVETQTLSMGMGLVAAMLGGAVQLTPEDYTALQELLPMLEDISARHPDPVIQELASDLRISIATHGAFCTDTITSAAHNAPGRTSKVTAGSEGTWSSSGEKADERKTCAEKRSADPGGALPSNITSEQVQELLVSAVDPQVPVRTAALRTLVHFLKQRESEILTHQEKILSLFLENLEHEDSFVYLAAIQGLAVLTDVFPQRILPRLLQEYRESPQTGGKKISSESRMKMGEVLMRGTRALGDLASHYRDPLIHAFLQGVRDPDNMLRASSLSNLGELCQRLRFALGPVVHEISSCLIAVVKTETDVEVRRAAVHVVTLLLRGLSKKATEVLADVLRNLYRLLKFVVQTDRDEVCVLHAQLALEELDDIMRQLLFPQQKLEKKITVLP
ncbi:transport and Golgi organization protein 6 homolog isoform X2 [Protopterus annectens]|uniref:transport and Golgi organization protein 6 homolog isoform X2 n=1 Tax=Protopterus annectens TaxID=7888 RepID=UPI001CF99629|nr:transport and Golgi organization protein 6 homolog isoform X2 [Protopterus annectens]